MAGQTINISVLADTSKFRRSMASLGRETGMSKLASTAKRTGAALLSLAKTASIAGAAAGVTLGKKAIDAAGDLEQSIGAIDTVFGKNAGQMHTWAAGAATSVGLTRNEFNELGTLIGTQLKNGGTAMDQLAPKTNSLIKLGADLSSMFGGTTREAVEALSSALKGERDPIERYGVSLNQAAIDAEAARLGFHKVGGTISAEANQAATLSLIMKQTADAHGNFARETNTLQHQQQVLKARLGNLAAELGMRLLPVATKVTAWASNQVGPAMAIATRAIGKIAPALRIAGQAWSAIMAGMQGKTPTVNLGPWTSRLAAAGAAMRTAWDASLSTLSRVAGFITGSLIPALSATISWLNRHRTAVAAVAAPFLTLAAAAKTYTATLALVKTAQAGYAAVTATVKAIQQAYVYGTYGQITAERGLLATQAGLLGALRTRIVLMGQDIAAGARVIASNTAQAASWVAQKTVMLAHVAVAGVVRAGQLAMAGAQWALNAAMSANPIGLVVIALAALGAGLVIAWKKSATFRAVVTGAWNAVKAAASAMGRAIMAVMRSVVAVLTSVIGAVKRWASNLTGSFGRAWTSARNATSRGISLVVSAIRRLPGRAASGLASLGSRIGAAFSRAWTAARNATSRGTSSLVSYVRSLPGRIVAGMGSIGSRTASIGRNIISGMVSGVRNSAGRLVSAARNAVGGAITAAKNKLGIHSPSRVFRTIGVQTVQGMVLGLQDRTNDLTRAATSIAETVTTNATPDAVDLSFSPSGHGAGSITVNVQCLDPTPAVGRIIVQAIRDAQRRGVAIA